MIKSNCSNLLKRTSKLIFPIHFRALLSWASRMKVALAKEKNYNYSIKVAKDHLLHHKMPLVWIRIRPISLMVNLDLSNHNHAEQVMAAQIKKRFKNNLNQQTLMTFALKQTYRETVPMMGWTKVEVTNFKAKSWYRWFKIKGQWPDKLCRGFYKVMKTKRRAKRMPNKPAINSTSQVKMSNMLKLNLRKQKIYSQNINRLKKTNLTRATKWNPAVSTRQAHP